MNAQENMQQPRVARETKNKIRVEFDRTPLWQRLKEKYISDNLRMSRGKDEVAM